MLLIFLVVLIVALIIANIVVFVSKGRKTSPNERGFTNTELDYVHEPEVVTTKVNELRENNALIQGSLQATNIKLEMLNERGASVEKIVMNMIQAKLDDETEDQTKY